MADKGEKNWVGVLMVAGIIVLLAWSASCIADSRGITCYGDDCPDALFVDCGDGFPGGYLSGADLTGVDLGG